MFEQLLSAIKHSTTWTPPPAIEGTPYKGFVSSTDLIDGNALATAVGLVGGTSQNSDVGWLHYVDPDTSKNVYIARKTIRYGNTAAQYNTAGLKDGKVITIQGKNYLVRNMTVMRTNPFVNVLSDTGGEWNKYMYPISISTNKPDDPNPGAVWSTYTDTDLGLAVNSNDKPVIGSISVGKDLNQNASVPQFACRGFSYDIAGNTPLRPLIGSMTVLDYSNPNDGSGGVGINAYGWRPILIEQ